MGTPFQDQVESDLAIFINPMEFAKVRDIDGVPTLCVLEADERLPDAAEGIYLSDSILFVKESDMPITPVVTQRMVIDSKAGSVVRVDGNMGLLVVYLKWFES